MKAKQPMPNINRSGKKISPRCLFTKKRFTLIELLIVIAILTLLLSFLMPALKKAIFKSRLTACTSNLKQISLGVMVYAKDYRNYYPTDGLYFGARIDTYAFNVASGYKIILIKHSPPITAARVITSMALAGIQVVFGVVLAAGQRNSLMRIVSSIITPFFPIPFLAFQMPPFL